MTVLWVLFFKEISWRSEWMNRFLGFVEWCIKSISLSTLASWFSESNAFKCFHFIVVKWLVLEKACTNMQTYKATYAKRWNWFQVVLLRPVCWKSSKVITWILFESFQLVITPKMIWEDSQMSGKTSALFRKEVPLWESTKYTSLAQLGKHKLERFSNHSKILTLPE